MSVARCTVTWQLLVWSRALIRRRGLPVEAASCLSPLPPSPLCVSETSVPSGRRWRCGCSWTDAAILTVSVPGDRAHVPSSNTQSTHTYFWVYYSCPPGGQVGAEPTLPPIQVWDFLLYFQGCFPQTQVSFTSVFVTPGSVYIILWLHYVNGRPVYVISSSTWCSD